MYRVLTLVVCGILFLGCGRPAEEQQATETEQQEVNPLAAFAGEWTLQAMPMDGDDVLVAVGMTATDNSDGWAMNFEHLSEPVPGQVLAVVGDSVTVSFGPYWSALRDEVMVTTRSVVAVSGDQMSGHFQAEYASGEPAVLHGRLQGARSAD